MSFFNFLSGVPGYFGGLMDQLKLQGISNPASTWMNGQNQLPPGTVLPPQAQGVQQAPGAPAPGQPGVGAPVNQAPGTTAPEGLLGVPAEDKTSKLEEMLRQAMVLQGLQEDEPPQAPVPIPAPAAGRGPLVAPPINVPQVRRNREDRYPTGPVRGFM